MYLNVWDYYIMYRKYFEFLTNVFQTFRLKECRSRQGRHLDDLLFQN